MSNEYIQTHDQVPLPSPQDLQTIADFGSMVLRDLVTLVCAALIYGLYLCVFLMSSRTLLRRWKESSSSLLLMILSTMVFVFQTLRIPVLLYLTITMINLLFGPSDSPVLEKRRDALKHPSLSHFAAVLHWTRAVTMIVADAIVVWRACILPNINRVVAIGLSGVMILNAGNITVYPFMATFARNWMREHIEAVQIQSNSILIFSVVTNFLATALIGWMAWQNHKSHEGLPGISGDSEIKKVLVTLTEAGVIYLVLQVVNILLNASVPLNLANLEGGIIIALDVMDEIVTGFAAVSPLIVILVVQDNRSIFGRTDTELSAFSAKPPTTHSQRCSARISLALENLGIPFTPSEAC
ncbi:hypothetical protein DL96DRAFT_1822856 [Flagelloscypha sp. PMI_526]|nr:hypothetical protein DL96DRAFT_1822856 [Flagelloscypha sp. PMI_526]